MLGIAYSASIGGLATPIGTPPNGVFLSVYEATTGQVVPFHQWMLLAGIVSTIMLIVAWVSLTLRLTDVGPIELPPAGKWTSAQRRTLLVFGLAATAWITRKIPWGGWSEWLDIPGAGDSTVALLAAVSLFLIPSGEGAGRRLLDWPTAVKIPWGILLLFGGGLAIANAFKTTGLSTVIGGQLVYLQDWPLVAVMSTVCLTVTFLTEVTSNTATASVMLPVLAAAAEAAHMAPALLMVPATLSASCAFMLPVATAPNALVFSSERVRIAEMARAGLVLNLVGTVVITLVCWQWLPAIFSVTAGR
jgi:sodium-dependent dicarboxylate transporter 2/3/5